MTAVLTRLGYAAKPISAIYDKATTFHDVTTGNNDPSGQCTDVNCNAGPGWDGPTGWGTPNAAAFLGIDGGVIMPDGGSGDAGDDGGGPNDAGGSSSGGQDAGGGSQDAGGSSSSSSGGGGSHDAGGGSSSGGLHDAGDSGTHPRDAGGSGSSSGGDNTPDSSLGDDDGGPGNGDTGGGSSGGGCSTTQGSTPAMPAGLSLLALAGLASVIVRRRRG